MSVQIATLGCYDRIAKLRELTAAAVAGGTDFWTKTDAAGDETFENRVNNSTVTAVDDAIAAGLSGDMFKPLLDLFRTYARTDLSLASPYLSSYLASIGQRVPYQCAEAITDAYGASGTLDPKYVFPKGTLVATAGDQAAAGLHEYIEIQGEAGASTVVPHDGALSSKVFAAPIMLVNQNSTCSIATPLVLRCTRADATTVDITLAALAASTQWAKTYVGQQLVGGAGAAAGQNVIPVAATAQFKAGEMVLIRQAADATVQEVGIVASLVANTSITVTTNLVNTYAENDLVFPMYTNIALQSGTMTQDKDVKIYALPDRVIAL